MEMCNGVGQRNHMALRSGCAGAGTTIRCDVDISIKRKAAPVINFEKVEKVVAQWKSNPGEQQGRHAQGLLRDPGYNRQCHSRNKDDDRGDRK